jgi:diguanylate cyclase (GGDEF)-like protein
VRNTLDWLSECAGVCGLLYGYPEKDISVECGQASNFSYCYDLEVGNLTIFSISKLSAPQREQLGYITSLLVNIFRSSLNYTEAISNSMIDHLTRVGNRSALEQDLQKEMALQNRQGSSQSTLLLFDLDKFKQVNDQLGHMEGDHLLVEISKTLKEIARDSDLIYRFGGDEFVMLLRGTSLPGAMHLAERLRQSINSVLSSYNNKIKDYTVSVSIGITEISLEDNIFSLLERFDGALYTAKNSGGNKTSNIQVDQNKRA